MIKLLWPRSILQRELLNQKGQTFFEFVFLILVLFSLSYVLLAGSGKGIGERWVKLITTIVDNNKENIQLR